MLRSFLEGGLVLAVIGRCALVHRLGVGEGRIQPGSTSPLKIVKARMRSARRRLRSSEKSLSWRSLSSYSTWRRSRTSRVARRWTLSSWFEQCFEYFTQNKSWTHRAIVGRVLRAPLFLKIGQMFAFHQSWVTYPLWKDLLYRAVIGSARKSARICNMKGWSLPSSVR